MSRAGLVSAILEDCVEGISCITQSCFHTSGYLAAESGQSGLSKPLCLGLRIQE